MKEIIKHAILTEKSNNLTERKNTYTFVVDAKANKIEIKTAIENMYSITVDSVNTIICGGGKRKVKYTNKGVAFQRNKRYKKAIVKVAKGDVIDVFENV